MNDVKTIFTDGIASVNFVNGLVRITIGSLCANEAIDTEEPKFKEEYTLIIPLNSFLAGIQSQQQLLDQLEERHIISKQPNTTNSDVPDAADNVVIP